MNTSAARRLWSLFQEAAASPDKMRARKVWVRVFGIDEKLGRHETEDAVMRLLQDVRDDLQMLEREARGKPVERLVGDLVRHARDLTSASSLKTDWGALRDNHLSPVLLNSWEWAALSFPANEDNVNEASLEALRSQLAELESAGNDPDLPIELRRFIAHHVQRIRAAIDRYRVRGIEPIREAITLAVGEVQRDHGELVESVARAGEKGVNATTQLGKVYRKMAEYAGDIDKFAKASNAIMQVVDKARPAIDLAIETAGKVIGAG